MIELYIKLKEAESKSDIPINCLPKELRPALEAFDADGAYCVKLTE